MALTTPQIMYWVLAALLPGIAAMTYAWGAGVLWNVLVLSCACAAAEAVCYSLTAGTDNWRARLRHIGEKLSDGTALVSAWLMAICLPPGTALHILLVAALGAIALAKHAYGGFGRNIFNPAMVGYALVLVSFPQGLAHWPVLAEPLDTLTGATPLSEFRYRGGLTVAEFEQAYAAALDLQTWVSAAFLLGGASLLYARLISWRIPAGMLAGVAACAVIGADQGSSASLGGWWFHVTSGGFAAAALFVATDPVTHPHGPREQFFWAMGIGVLIYVIRAYGSFPDGIAFAVLLGNCAVPLLNRWARQRAGQPAAAEGQPHV